MVTHYCGNRKENNISITAKIKVTGKNPIGDNQTTLRFGVNYTDDKNKEWARFTPILNFSIVVRDSVAKKFELNRPYILILTPDVVPEAE